MCGIAGGVWRHDRVDIEERMNAALGCLRHRGPDDRGYSIAREPGRVVGIGQTRLSIIDLSAGGHQPMFSADGSSAIVFNGEIYNYRELREELRAAGRTFHTESDTEVLLAAWQAWGVACLPRLEGMFAFVVHDRARGRLICARDAFGIKPFYYEQNDEGMLFASEQSALRALRGRSRHPDLQRAYDYLAHGVYDSQERTFIEGVRHLRPGTLLDIDLASRQPASPIVWWRPSIKQSSRLSFAEAADAVREQFLHNIRLHLRSDVPLGTALSGGIDSSAVVCAIRHVEPEMPIHTFSYIAEGSPVSEEKWVDIVNAAIGAIPHKVTVNGSDLARDLEKLVAVQGEPFGGTSGYAQYRVFQLARECGVTVTLDGQGADELLAGYQGYPGLRMLSLLESGRLVAMNAFARKSGRWPGRSYAKSWMEFGRAVLPDGIYALSRKRLGHDDRPAWLKTDLLQDAGVELLETRPQFASAGPRRRVIERLAYSLQNWGLPHLLRHGDRNSMAFSIESRVPFLTIPMADLMLSLPEHYLISNTGETKSVFRAAMRGIVPDAILDRRDKIGFDTPEQGWLMDMAPTLREWLHDAALVPFLDQSAVLREFDRVMNGEVPFKWQVWRWVNYVKWYTTQGFSSDSGGR